MEKSPSELLMKRMTAVSAVCLAAGILLYKGTGGGVWLTVAITAGTFFYHLAMRLIVGFIAKKFIGKKLDYRSPWFLQRRWEKTFYKKIGIKKWKNKLPTYYPQDFSPKEHSPQELLQTMCTSETSHELMILLSFVPLFFSKWFGAFGVFLVTSLCAGAFDMVFVLIQRYNRGRLEKTEKRSRHSTNTAV